MCFQIVWNVQHYSRPGCQHWIRFTSAGRNWGVTANRIPTRMQSSMTDIWSHSGLVYAPMSSKLWRSFRSMTLRSLSIHVSPVIKLASRLSSNNFAKLNKPRPRNAILVEIRFNQISNWILSLLWLCLILDFFLDFLLWGLPRRWQAPPYCCTSRTLAILLSCDWYFVIRPQILTYFMVYLALPLVLRPKKK